MGDRSTNRTGFPLAKEKSGTYPEQTGGTEVLTSPYKL